MCVCVCVWCVCVVCLCVVCLCVVCVCVCGVFVCGVCECFLKNTYLQHVPLHGNNTCSRTHMILCLSFWSVFGTTCGNRFRTMTNYRSV